MRTWIISIGQSLLVFFAPVAPLLIAVGMAIFADTYFGIKKARKFGEYRTKELRIGFTRKIITYHLSILTFYIIDALLLNELLIQNVSIDHLLTKLLCLVFIFIEWESINETSKKLYKRSFNTKIIGIFKKIKGVKDDVNNF